MAKEEKIQLEAEVTEALPDARFKVKLENGQEILAYVSGKMRKFFIRILPGGKRPESVWRSPELRGNYDTPVRHGKHLYGFTGRYLTCFAKEETGA